MIRAARPGDVPALPAVQRAAGARFRDAGMAEVADLAPAAADRLTDAVRAGLLWVCTGGQDRPTALLLASVVPGAAHIEQVSVHPARAGRGIGAALIEHLGSWAAERGLAELTLTAFSDVPWNAPYYERLGFVRVPESRLRPEEKDRARRNAAGPLGGWPRVAMRRPVREPAR
jgi:GNAT superfamily N-acetyltransferase